jgi:hypothetical protein
MCKASKYLEEMSELLQRVKSDYDSLVQKLSYYDTLISEHYHKIEVMNFNACEGYYLSDQLQKLLRKRRIVKDEMSRLNTLKQTLDFSKMHNSINHSKQCINKAKKKTEKWQQDWKYTYTLEEVLH